MADLTAVVVVSFRSHDLLEQTPRAGPRHGTDATVVVVDNWSVGRGARAP